MLLGFFWPGWGFFFAGYPSRALLVIALIFAAPSFFNLSRLAFGPGPWISRLNYLELMTFLLIAAFSTLGPTRLAQNTSDRERPTVLLTLLALLVYSSLSGLFHDLLWWNRKLLERHSLLPLVFAMKGGDMEPSVNYGDDYIVNVWSKQPTHGEIVAYQPDPSYRGQQEQKVSRVAGVPGDTIEIGHGRMTRNDSLVDEPWRRKVRCREYDRSMPPTRVPAGQYLCVSDQRFPMYLPPCWELIPKERILGRVVLISNSVDDERVGLDPATAEPVR